MSIPSSQLVILPSTFPLLICIVLLMTKRDFEHLFIAYCQSVYFFYEIPIQIFTYVLVGLFILLFNVFWDHICIYAYIHVFMYIYMHTAYKFFLPDICIANILSQSVAFILQCLSISRSFEKSNLHVFILWIILFMSYLPNLCLTQGHKDFFLCFLLKVYDFRPTISFELTFMYCTHLSQSQSFCL